MESVLLLPRSSNTWTHQLKLFMFSNARFWAALEQRPHWLAPTLMVISLSIALTVAYYSSVDIEWLRSEIAARYPELPADGFTWMNRRAMITSGIASFALIYPMVIMGNAIYLFLYSKVLGDSRALGPWFAFASWCALPSALGMLAGLLLVLMGGPRQSFEAIFNSLSIVTFIDTDALPQSAALLAGLFSAPLVLQLLATATGLRLWLKIAWLHAAAVSVIPIAVMYLWMMLS